MSERLLCRLSCSTYTMTSAPTPAVVDSLKVFFFPRLPFLIPKFLGKSPLRCCLWIKLSDEDGRRRETSIKELPFQNSMESCLRSQILDKRLFYFFYIFSVSQAQQKQDIPSCLCYGCACECMCLCVPRPPPPSPFLFPLV